MPSPRILSTSALIERDASTGPGSTGSGAVVPAWTTVTASEPCAPPQPITDKLKRLLPGDFEVAAYMTMLAITADVAKGDRVTIAGARYRVEARDPWRSGPGRAHHIRIGITPGGV